MIQLNKHLLIMLFILLFALTSSAANEKIIAIRFTGDIHTPEELRMYAEIADLTNFRESRMEYHKSRLIKNLIRAGYPLVGFRTCIWNTGDHNTQDTVTIIVEEGPSLTGIFSIDGDTTVIIPSLTEAFMHDLAMDTLRQFVARGFPFAEVSYKPSNPTITEDSAFIQIKMDIDPGDFMRFNSIQFNGARTTNNRFFRLQTRIRRGDIFSPVLIENAEKALAKTTGIQTVRDVKLHPVSPGLLDVIFDIESRSMNSLSAILAVDPQDQELRGEANLEFANLMGNGRQLSFQWNGLEQDRSEIALSYTEPWLFDTPFHLTTYGSFSNQDSLSNTVEFGGSLQYQPTFNVSLGGNLAYQRQILSPGDSLEQRYITYWAGLSASLDYRDFNMNPSQGFFAETKMETGLRRTAEENDQQVHRQAIRLEYAHSLGNSLIGFTSVRIEDISGDFIDLNELPALGGTNSLRGYRERQFPARGIILQSLEFRWRPDRNGFIGVFNDLGYIYREDSRAGDGDLFFGSYGINSYTETRAGRLGLSLALPYHENIDYLKLHVRFSVSF